MPKEIDPSDATRRVIVLVFLIPFLIALIAGGLAWRAHDRAPRARLGLLDLSSWQFKTNAPAPLSGEWDLYWNQLLEPGDLAEIASTERSYLRLPGDWRRQFYAEKRLPRDGYATLRLRVYLPLGADSLSLEIPHIQTAYRLWANGQLIAAAGQVGTGVESSVPHYRPKMVELGSPGQTLELVVQMSNYHHRSGGWMDPLLLRTDVDAIGRERTARFQSMILGGFLVLGLHYLALYWLQPARKDLLLWAVLGWLSALYAAVLHDLVLTDVDGLGWELRRKLFYVLPMSVAWVAIQITCRLFPDESGHWPARLSSGLFPALIGLVLVLPARIYTQYLAVMLLLLTGTHLFLHYTAARASIRGRRNGLWILIGTVGVSFASALEYLRTLGLQPLSGDWNGIVWVSIPLVLMVIHVGHHKEVLGSQQVLLEQNQALTGQLQAQLEQLRGARLLLAGQEERQLRSIAEFLHSRVQTKLILAAHQLSQLKGLVKGHTEAAAVVERVRERLDDVRQNDIRLVSHQLHPAAISVGLTTAMQTLAAEYQDRFHVTVEHSERMIALDNPERSLVPEPARLTAYRVVAEALSNAAIHAEATSVQITLDTQNGDLLLKVQDNGRGLVPEKVQPGLGLTTLSARIAEIGGSITIHSSPGSGTRLEFNIPMQPTAEG